MLHATKHMIEVLQVIDEEGIREELLRVTPIVFLGGVESRIDKNSTFTTRSGEDVNDIGGGMFETFGGSRWRITH